MCASAHSLSVYIHFSCFCLHIHVHAHVHTERTVQIIKDLCCNILHFSLSRSRRVPLPVERVSTEMQTTCVDSLGQVTTEHSSICSVELLQPSCSKLLTVKICFCECYRETWTEGTFLFPGCCWRYTMNPMKSYCRKCAPNVFWLIYFKLKMWWRKLMFSHLE